MSTIEESLKRAYLANGGTEAGFEGAKGELIAQHRNQATIAAALEESRRPAAMNDLIRSQMHGLGDAKARLGLQVIGTQKGENDAA